MNFVNEPAIGTILAARFEVLERIGAGGMGAVFRVMDLELREQIALKLIHPNVASDGSAFERFRNEVLLARSLAHPNIVRTFDIGRAPEGFYYLTMELVVGASLKSKIEQARENGQSGLPLSQAVTILRQVLKAISYAHTRGIIHRDLKPANIMLDMADEVKLADFGTARLLKSQMELTPAGHIIGTPHYMSPEQIRGGSLDQRCDLYALGIIAFELLSGVRPFDSDNYVAAAYLHLSEEMPMLSSKGIEVPGWYEEIIQKATQKDPEKRYVSADEFIAALDEHTPAIVTSGIKPPLVTREDIQRSSKAHRNSKSEDPPTLAGPRGVPPPVSEVSHSLRNFLILLLSILGLFALLSVAYWRFATPRPAPAAKEEVSIPAPTPLPTEPAVATETPTAVPTEASPTATATVMPTHSSSEATVLKVDPVTPAVPTVAQLPIVAEPARPTPQAAPSSASPGELYFRERGQSATGERYRISRLSEVRWIVSIHGPLQESLTFTLHLTPEGERTAVLKLKGELIALGTASNPEVRAGGTLAEAKVLSPGTYRADVQLGTSTVASAVLVLE